MAPCRTIAADGTLMFTCASCALQFGCQPKIQSSTTVTDEEARAIASNRSQQCENLRQYIRSALDQHGDLVYSRWRKKTRAKRAAMMLQVEPNMVLEPDYDAKIIYESDHAFARRSAAWKNDELKLSQQIFRAFTLPFLNSKTLQDDPMRLLSLLHHRSCSKLEDWVSYDMSLLHDVDHRSGKSVGVSHNKNCIVMRGEHFGELVECDQEKCHSLEIIGFPTARNIFIMQEELLLFLSNMVQAIIGPAELPSGNDRWVSLLSTGFKLSGSVECWSQFANPFARPPKFELIPCLQQVKAHLTEAEDELKLLQTDPEYVLCLPYVKADVAPVRGSEKRFGEARSRDKPAGNAVNALTRSIDKVINLGLLVKQCEHVVEALIVSKHSTETSNASDPSYDKALSGLYLLASQLCIASKRDIGELLWTSPGFSSAYTIHRGRGDPTIDFKVYRQMFYSDKLHWLLCQIYSAGPYDNSTKEASILASIEEYLEKADYKERSRVSGLMYRHLSTTAIYQQIQTNIALCRPDIVWGGNERTFHAQLAMDRVPRRKEDTIPLLSKLRADILDLRKHSWPRGRRNEAWLIKADEIRKCMSSFWDNSRNLVREVMSSDGHSERTISETMVGIEYDRAPEYLSRLEAERAEILSSKSKQDKGRTATTVAVPVQTVWGEDGDNSKLDLAVDRVKPKTRPVLSELHNHSDRDVAVGKTPSDEPANRVPVNAESIRVFSKLFATGSEPMKGIVKWQQVVTALCDAGLVGTNVGGSAVNFKSLAENSQGSIVFHKPHPEPNLDFIHQRNMGKRLHKWFGWTAETFVERKKPTEKGDTADKEEAQEED